MTERDAATVCNLIERSTHPLTWNEIIVGITEEIGYTWTRQALARHPTIKAAYRAKHDSRETRKKRVDPSLDFLLAKTRALDEENKRLEELVKTYQAMFVRYQHNAHARGISQAELDKPFLPIERRRSDR